MTPEEKAKRDAEFEAKGYIKDYIYYEGKLVESWREPVERATPAPRLLGRDESRIKPDFKIR